MSVLREALVAKIRAPSRRNGDFIGNIWQAERPTHSEVVQHLLLPIKGSKNHPGVSLSIPSSQTGSGEAPLDVFSEPRAHEERLWPRTRPAGSPPCCIPARSTSPESLRAILSVLPRSLEDNCTLGKARSQPAV